MIIFFLHLKFECLLVTTGKMSSRQVDNSALQLRNLSCWESGRNDKCSVLLWDYEPNTLLQIL